MWEIQIMTENPKVLPMLHKLNVARGPCGHHLYISGGSRT